jgi:signal transduction histidine kinase
VHTAFIDQMMPNFSEPLKPEPQPNKTLEEEIGLTIYQGREFTLADVIAREAGNFMKGESTVPRLVQVETEINTFISQNLRDVSGALQAVLRRWVSEDTARVSQHFEVPLTALLGLLESILDNPPILYELVRQVDMLWGEINGERPYFQQPGQPPHPDDEYTHESVQQQLTELVCCLKASQIDLNSAVNEATNID